MAAGIGVVGRTPYALRYRFESGDEGGEVQIEQSQVIDDLAPGPLREYLSSITDDSEWTNLGYRMKLETAIQSLPTHNVVTDSHVGVVGAEFTIAVSLARIFRVASPAASVANVELRFRHSIDR